MLLVDRIAMKPNFSGYTYLDEMKSEALVNLCNVWDRFDQTKSDNPFSFFTMCVMNTFKQVLKVEKLHRNIRDQELIYAGLNPSEGYQHQLHKGIKRTKAKTKNKLVVAFIKSYTKDNPIDYKELCEAVGVKEPEERFIKQYSKTKQYRKIYNGYIEYDKASNLCWFVSSTDP